MKKSLVILFFLIMAAGCASAIDISKFTPEEHLDYAIKLYQEEDFTEALQQFKFLNMQYAGNPINDDVQYYLAKTYFGRREYLLAAYEFSKLIKNMPSSTFVAESQFFLADCYFELSPFAQLDQQYSQKSTQEFQSFLDFFPTHEKASEAEKKIVILNDRMAEKEFNNAVIYEKMEYYTAALQYYTLVTSTYHETHYAPKAYYNKIKLLVSIDRYDEAKAEIEKYLLRHSDDENASEIKSIKEKLK